MRLNFSKAYGCLAGLALGDALGMPTEFLTTEQISGFYGQVRSLVKAPFFHPHAILEPGAITDDTGQSLAVAHAYNDSGWLSADSVARELLAWSGALCEDHLAIIIGSTTRQALTRIREGTNPREAGVCSNTNGAAMRVAAIAIVNINTPNLLLHDVEESCLPTHCGSPAIAGATAVAFAISEALRPNSSLSSILDAASQGAQQSKNLGKWMWSTNLEKRIELAKKLIHQATDEVSALRALYNYVGVDMLVCESIATALGIVYLAAGDPMRAIYMAVNLGGDTDTIAAIAGAICGAWSGIERIDQELLRQIQQINGFDLEAETEKLVEISNTKSKGSW